MNMVNYEKFDIPTNRFIAIFTQILPLLLIKLKASLKIVAIAYSLNFILFHISLSIIIMLKFKDYTSALLLLFAHVLSGNINFYFPISEYQMGLSLLIFFISYLLYLSKENLGNFKIYQYLLLAFIITTIIYAHPLMIIISLFSIFYIAISNTKISKKHSSIIIVSILSITAFKWLIGTIGYDITNASKTLNYKEFFPYFWETNSFKFFIQHTISYNYFFLLSFVIITYYLFKKQFAKTILFSSFIVFYILIVMVVNLNEPNYNHYTEHLYQAIAFFIAIPLFYDVFKNVNQKVLLVFFIAFFIIKLNTIFHFSNYNGYRISWIKERFKENPKNTKLLYFVENVEETIKYSIWIIAIESLLISSIEDDLPTGTIHILRYEKDIKEKLNNSDVFLTDWGGSYSIKETMSKYHFPLDSSNYKYFNPFEVNNQ